MVSVIGLHSLPCRRQAFSLLHMPDCLAPKLLGASFLCLLCHHRKPGVADMFYVGSWKLNLVLDACIEDALPTESLKVL